MQRKLVEKNFDAISGKVFFQHSYFIFITTLVISNKISFIDSSVYNFLISFKNDSLTNFFRFITKFSNVAFLVIFVLIVLLILRNKDAVFVIFNLIFLRLLNYVIKIIIKRDRPNILRLIKIGEYSFPSGHAMISMGVYGYLIYLIYKKIKNPYIKYLGIIILSLLIILIGISRIYLGVHYFSDVVAGYTLSLIYLIIFIRVRRKYNV